MTNSVDTSGHGACSSATPNKAGQPFIQGSNSTYAGKKTAFMNDDTHEIQNDLEGGKVNESNQGSEGFNNGYGTTKGNGRRFASNDHFEHDRGCKKVL